MSTHPTTSLRALLGIALILACLLACTLSTPPAEMAGSPFTRDKVAAGLPVGTATRTPFLPPTSGPGDPLLTPTPNLPRTLPTPRTEVEQYVVRSGDTLRLIAQQYGVPYQIVADANNLTNPDLLTVGQLLEIPPPQPVAPGPGFKIIPDSELVYGPVSAVVDYPALVRQRSGYLNYADEEMDGEPAAGVDIIRRVAQDYSVNPLLLLAVLEHQSGWINNTQPISVTRTYPIGLYGGWRKGLYSQMVWTANQLNTGYYLWQVNAVGTWLLADGTYVPIDPTINAGTAAVQYLFAQLYGEQEWRQAVAPMGLFRTYSGLWGNPFDLSVDPLVPPDLEQPVFQLPFEPGRPWSFSGGPHGGWDSGSAWAALDFAPPGEPLGCIPSRDWVVAVADGLIVRTGNGAVVQDLDGDGFEQTGWTILYMHIQTHERVETGAYVKAGERIGHPSCEGGFSTGTHLHIARRYNGEWIPADQSIPFVMDGWVSAGSGVEYNGYLTKGGRTVEAYDRRGTINVIQR